MPIALGNNVISSSVVKALNNKSITTQGLIINLDAGLPDSYPGTGVKWYSSGGYVGIANAEVLIVGGGGGGGAQLGGGGGGGGVIYTPMISLSPNTAYTITVGGGGAASTNGANTTAFGMVAAGGGSSGVHDSGDGSAGGSGGGAASNNSRINVGGAASGSSSPFPNSVIYGNAGGSMTTARTGTPTRGAGGGGAGLAGPDTNSNVSNGAYDYPGSGGDGILIGILGAPYYWGAGGGGGAYEGNTYGGRGGYGGGGGGACNGGTGGLGGVGGLNAGANGAAGDNVAGGAGGTNTGSGGGAGSWSSGAGGAGGSGIVVIRYPGSQQATGGTITSVGGCTIHSFTSSGTFEVYSNSATLINGPTYSSSYGGVIAFDGVNDYAVLYRDLSGAVAANYAGFTVIAASRYVVSAGAGRVVSGLYNNWLMGHWGASTLNYYSAGWVTAGTGNAASGGTGPSDTNWRIYAATGISGTYKFYVNGVLDTTNSTGTAGPNGFMFGNYGNAGSPDTEWSNSQIGFVMVYNRVLSTAEILQIYNVQKSRFGLT